MVVTVDSKTYKLLPNSILYSSLAIIGRGTVVVRAKSDHNAMKIYWPEEDRPNEAEVISLAIKSGGDDPNIRNHLPTVLATQDVGYNTGTVRVKL